MKKTKMLSPDDIAKAMGFAAARSYYRHKRSLREGWRRLRAYLLRHAGNISEPPKVTPGLAVMVAIALLLPGCSFVGTQASRLFDLIAHPAATFKQQWEVCEGPKAVLAENLFPLGAEFPVAKPGDCAGDRMMVYASVARPKVLESALAVSTGQTVTVEGEASGMRIVAISITRFKVRKDGT